MRLRRSCTLCDCQCSSRTWSWAYCSWLCAKSRGSVHRFFMYSDLRPVSSAERASWRDSLATFSHFARFLPQLACMIANPSQATICDIAALCPPVLDIRRFAVCEVAGMHCASRCACDVLAICATDCAARRHGHMPIATQCARYRVVPWSRSRCVKYCSR